MEDIPKPGRRWPRFSLRTMLVLLTLVCVFCGYLGWAMNWKRQRQAYLKSPEIKHRWVSEFETTPPPWSLYLLGESGESFLVLAGGDEEKIAAVSRLFPEAKIGFYEINRVEFDIGPGQVRWKQFHTTEEESYSRKKTL